MAAILRLGNCCRNELVEWVLDVRGQVVPIILRLGPPILLILLLELLLDVLEALLNLAADLLARRVLHVDPVEECTVLVADEVEDFALGEGRDLVPVLTMAVEETVDLDIAVEQHERAVLVRTIEATLAAHELNVLLQEELLVLPIEVAVDGFLLQQALIDEEEQFLLQVHE